MHTAQTLMEDLRNSGLKPSGTVLVHSSMKAIGQVEGGADTVLAAISSFMASGLLIFPTHTWHEDNMKDNVYDVRSEPSCVGLLTNLFRQRPGVVRSMHPSHSVAALGNNAIEYVDKDRRYMERCGQMTPCPREGCFGSLYDEKAQILFLGAPLTTNTYIHGIEEWLDIPERLRESPRHMKLIDGEGKASEIDLYGHYNPYGDVSKNYDKLEGIMIEKGIAHICKIGDAKCYVIDVVPMTELVVALLKKDSDLFVDRRPLPEL